MRGTYYQERRADAGTGTEAQRGVDVLDRDVGPARPPSKDAADNPTALAGCPACLFRWVSKGKGKLL
jgi:hypothetical protein